MTFSEFMADPEFLSYLQKLDYENELDHKQEKLEVVIASRIAQKRKMPNKSKRFEIMKQQNWRCKMCKCRIAFSKAWAEKFNISEGNIDHIHPFSERDSYEGDINCLENFQALCFDCNMKKGKKVIYGATKKGV